VSTRDGAGDLRTSALAYFGLALGWSWAFWAASIAWHPGADPVRSPLFLLAGAGPPLAAVLLTQLREPPPVRRDYWLRVADPRRIRGMWWAAALLLHPALVALAIAADALLGGAPPSLRLPSGWPAALPALVFFVFWFGPLPEELGWRGFAQDRLQVRWSALRASLVLGAVWALWHLPLFLVPGTFQAGLRLGSGRSFVFLASMVPLSVLIGWIYANTRRSTLSAVLVHFSGNLSGELFPKTDRVAAIELVLLSLAAAAVTWRWGAARLSRS
jgi:membrane protease YdiL (CAAX protease family)